MSDFPDITEPDFIGHHNVCRPFTMTSTERLYSLYNAIRFVISAEIEGDFVACGVWKGGSVMMMAMTLKSLGIVDRNIYVYDTFEGMPAPTDLDRDLLGRPAEDILQASEYAKAYSPLDEVKTNLQATGYPMERFIIVPGDVCKTIPKKSPARIALLRLDTDWYESTRHELMHFFPRLSDRGVLIIDDYGHWDGARRAVDEYFAGHKQPYLMNRIDYTGRILVKS